MKLTRPLFEGGLEEQHKPSFKEKIRFLTLYQDRFSLSTHTTFEFTVSYRAVGWDNQLGNIPIAVWVGLPTSISPDSGGTGI
jgi:hypothetical protein